MSDFYFMVPFPVEGLTTATKEAIQHLIDFVRDREDSDPQGEDE